MWEHQFVLDYGADKERYLKEALMLHRNSTRHYYKYKYTAEK